MGFMGGIFGAGAAVFMVAISGRVTRLVGMTDDRKAELRELLKPGSPEPTAEQFDILDAFWTEYCRRFAALAPSLSTPLVATDAMTPALARQWILDAVAAMGVEPADAATVEIVEVR